MFIHDSSFSLLRRRRFFPMQLSLSSFMVSCPMSLSFVHRRFVLMFVAIVLCTTLHFLLFVGIMFVDVCCSELFFFVSVEENEKLVLLAWARTSDPGSPEVREYVQ